MPSKNQTSQEESGSKSNSSSSSEGFDLGKIKTWDIVDTSDGSLMKKSQNSDDSSQLSWNTNQEE